MVASSFQREWRSIKLIGDSAYSVIDLGLLCQESDVTLIAPIRLDARLFEPASPRVAGTMTMGRPRVVGQCLPLLSKLATDLSQPWQLAELK